jgi:hypothetical protein
MDQAASLPQAEIPPRDQSPALSQVVLSGKFIAELLENLTHLYAKDPISPNTTQLATIHSPPSESPLTNIQESPHPNSPSVEAMDIDAVEVDPTIPGSDAAVASSVKGAVDATTGESSGQKQAQKKRKLK